MFSLVYTLVSVGWFKLIVLLWRRIEFLTSDFVAFFDCVNLFRRVVVPFFRSSICSCFAFAYANAIVSRSVGSAAKGLLRFCLSSFPTWPSSSSVPISLALFSNSARSTSGSQQSAYVGISFIKGDSVWLSLFFSGKILVCIA